LREARKCPSPRWNGGREPGFRPAAVATGMHITEHDLERYHLGLVDGIELEGLEEHLLGCSQCADRALETEAYESAMRAAMGKAGFGKVPLRRSRARGE